jgi:hypothetical protein
MRFAGHLCFHFKVGGVMDLVQWEGTARGLAPSIAPFTLRSLNHWPDGLLVVRELNRDLKFLFPEGTLWLSYYSFSSEVL